jgi:hypothetical protein
VRQNIVIIDAWTIVDCRNVSRWGREHVSKKKPNRKQEDDKRKQRHGNSLGQWREQKCTFKASPTKETRKK